MGNSDSQLLTDESSLSDQSEFTLHSPFSKILIYITGSDVSMEAIRVGIRIASVHKLPIILLYVIEEKMVEGVASFSRESNEVARRQIEMKSRQYLEYAEQLAYAQRVNCRPTVRKGIPHSQITEVARDAGVDLIVIGDNRQPMGRWSVGSGLIDRVIEYAHCSVLVVRSP